MRSVWLDRIPVGLLKRRFLYSNHQPDKLPTPKRHYDLRWDSDKTDRDGERRKGQIRSRDPTPMGRGTSPLGMAGCVGRLLA